MIDPTRVIPRVLLFVLAGIAFVLLVQIELRRRNTQNDTEIPNKLFFDVWNSTSEIYSAASAKSSRVKHSAEPVTDDISNSRISLELSHSSTLQDANSSPQQSFKNISFVETNSEFRNVPDEEWASTSQNYKVKNETNTSIMQNPSSVKFQNCFSIWDAIIFITLSGIFLFLFGSFCWLAERLLWKGRHFSLDKWSMSGNEEMKNFTSLVRQRRKFLTAEFRPTGTDESAKPLLSRKNSICKIESPKTLSLFSMDSLKVITTSSQSSVTINYSSFFDPSLLNSSFRIAKSPVPTTGPQLAEPSAQTTRVPMTKS
ncbi:uncharacterized protein LOC143239141 [Tachypleus tridentatus]|uniref:uncharacterized protein LOC143239141 n=1 Tax=Tachypleus tridentatus TaxID=6853 RepID=UPI003FD375C3